MRRILLLAWRYVAFNRLKTALLVACVTITLALPVAVHLLVRRYNRELIERAETTPLIVGAKGSRFDLCLRTLYFGAEEPEYLPAGEADVIREDEERRGTPIPVYARYTAQKRPVVGTTFEYFEFRGLELAEGEWPMTLGECVLGSKVAEELGLGAGDKILTDKTNIYDISQGYALLMHITGVLAESGSPDDHAIFADLKTVWIVDGRCHGHMDIAKTPDPRYVLTRTKGNVVGNPALFVCNEITPGNIDSFHFHGDPATFPITSLIVVPKDDKSATILGGYYNVSKDRQMIVPLEVIGELMGIVFQVEMFFKANFGVVLVSTGLFLVLVVMLSLRIRRREMETMFRIGCSRMTVFWLQAAELVMILGMSAVLAAGIAGGLLLLAPELVRVM